MKTYWGFLVFAVLLSQNSWAYDPCDVKFAFNSLAESQCYRIPQKNKNEEFIISAVKLTKELSKVEEKDNVILIPGGPGTDAQAIGLSLNKKGIMDAMWAHMDMNVVLFDPRGTGKSLLKQSAEFYTPADFSTDLQVDDLKKVVDAVSPKKPVYLLAHSAGGDLAAKYAALFPDRVKGLVLYSASIDTREIGESNLRLFAKDFSYWDEYLKTCPAPIAKNLKDQQAGIEFFLRNVLKLQRIKNIRPPRLQSRFYLKDFRVDMIMAIENDPGCSSRVVEVLDLWQKRITDLPVDVKEQVDQMTAIKFDPNNYSIPTLTRGTWIKTAVICSEGITHDEMNQELWLEGVNFSQDTCFGVKAFFDVPPSREWLGKIKGPTLLIGGKEDPFQVPSAVLRNSRSIPNSQVILIEGGGHESHQNHPLEFYKIMEKFLKSQ
ncbi:hypothetical protein AZI86_01200 [Bdellovibrio bacteriovorus]|uniref:AB hydrolase-1 domain-containing protein n=1 Tax=Bdellovibrio bacteriovorus TaxID=959 RepID=A0A150WMK6_BDEBC|nr:alpha/beta fold hydrolase [Bdellovibrio bacteriovorus]KYG65721.1 hypothetical protein AZI86_01200 [Bdellovibrio bacteriovorus]